MTPEKRLSSISFTKAESQNLNEPSDLNDDENTQMSIDPHVQTYLAQLSQQSGCWGRFLPIPFERAASKSWWDPTFDSEILEEQFKKSASPHHTLTFRYVLWYLLFMSACWFLYFLVFELKGPINRWPILCIVLAVLILSVIMVLIVTYTTFFTNHMTGVCLSVALLLCAISITFTVLTAMKQKSSRSHFPASSPVGQFAVCIEVLLLIYTVIPLRLYVCVMLGALYSLTFELVIWYFSIGKYSAVVVTVRFLLHLCIHFVGLHILVMTNVRMRNTFMKVGQSLLVRRQLESEKKLKENMILSLMPPSVAHWLMNDDENFKKNGRMSEKLLNPFANDIKQSLFRPFNMSRMENVSILFADIVGFTRMSSTKTAEQLVDILNNLFGRFDLLCKLHYCEKISTLGDCYYCVSGCPEARIDHAKCCVEMGLSMIQAIKQFDTEQNEGVNMRVGVHTGTILCGIVGTKRFKFDVWSNDVSLANTMESTGKPEMVHISEKTLEFLPDIYLLEEGQPVSGLKTYFILGRKYERNPSFNGSYKGIEKSQNASLQLVVSPPISPPSMSPQTRPRILSCDTGALSPLNNPNYLSPDVCKIKASSLPSILDSDNEQDIDAEKDLGDHSDHIKTPTSTSSSGRYTVKVRNWKIPKFLKKTTEQRDNVMLEIEPGPVQSDLPSMNYTGYQQVPTIIEGPSMNNQHVAKLQGSWSNMNQNEEDKSLVYFEELKDTIDVKSYISQSRSDIGPYEFASNDFSHFIRTGSYRSQYGRSPNDFSFLTRAGSNRSRRGKSPNVDIVPSERARSATVTQIERPKKSLEVPTTLPTIFTEDRASTAQSINSRKDSGIRSNSRKSSIQQIETIYPTSDNLQHHRVSGYFTSSQSTICSQQYATKVPRPRCIQNLRKQSDRQLIKCVQDNSKSKRSYFVKPPLWKFSLFFKDKKVEQEYRRNVHSISEQTESIPTLANSKFNTYLDVFISAMVFFLVATCLFILFEPSALWLVVFCICIFIQFCAAASCSDKIERLSEHFLGFISRWYRWNAFGGLLVSLPLVAVFVNVSCPHDMMPKGTTFLYSCLLFVAIIHFCNFTQLNCWMKNILVTIFVITYIILIMAGFREYIPTNALGNFQGFKLNITVDTVQSHSGNLMHRFDSDMFMHLIMLLILVWILNREFEINYRLSFHAHHVANRDKINVQMLKNQADWLIYNIVPEHVAEDLKKHAKYSENFKDAGIIFASVVNFNLMYDETYMGGKEFLRVLNELIGDFDDLLNLPQYYCVEKIKTIGSTFMAASGLNSRMRGQQDDPHEHLCALMEFALDMQKVVENFNRNLLEFNLILRIGYNFGDVTAAVIGSSKLYYDIWGDAVNIASRMDSTGVNGKIQVGEHCLEVLEKKYVFERRGSVYVKGKDDMNVYLLLHKRDEL